MALQVTGTAPSIVDDNGGVRVTLSGSFVLGRAYRVFVGSDASGTPCYSGVSGQASNCIANSTDALDACLPEVSAGSFVLCVVDTTTEETATVTGQTEAQAPFLNAMTYALRSDIRGILATGETAPSQLPDATTVPGFAS